MVQSRTDVLTRAASPSTATGVLVSYGLTVTALQAFLPVDTRLNARSVRRDTLSIARRLEAELGPEPVFPLAGCPGDCASLPPPPEPITVGLDGGSLRHWEHEQAHFVALVGESVPRDGATKRFSKKQSMQWTSAGAHLLLQIRTRTLNRDLAATFRQWYPASALKDQPDADNLLAA